MLFFLLSRCHTSFIMNGKLVCYWRDNSMTMKFCCHTIYNVLVISVFCSL